MTAPFARLSRPGRLLCGLFVLLLGAGALPLWTGDLAAQAPGQKKGEEGEEAKPKDKRSRKEEVEDEKPRKKLRVIDVDEKEEKAPRAPALDDQPADVDSALKQTKNFFLKELYHEFVKPHDLLVLSSQTRKKEYAIEPLERYYPDKNPKIVNNSKAVNYYNDDWSPGGRLMIRTDYVHQIIPFEDLACIRVEMFLADKRLDQHAEGSKNYVSRGGMLRAAVLVLSAAQRFHDSAIQTGKRDASDDRWDRVVGARLHKKLLEVRLAQLALYAADNDWRGAADHARSLAEAYPDPKDREEIAGKLVSFIERGLGPDGADDGGENRYKVARDRLRLLENLFPGAAASGSLTNRMSSQAKRLSGEAEELDNKGKKEEALRRRRLAYELFPRLPGLENDLKRLEGAYPILRVGVRSLPSNLLPGWATTDVDRMAVELMFEGLVRLRDDPKGGARYEPALAAGMPSLAGLSRDFRLAPNAYWSDGERVSADDVAVTLHLLLDERKRWEGAVPGLGKLLADKVELGGDVFRLSLNLNQGYLDPLSLMTFKILPRGVEGNELKRNKQPVGSGPYSYAGQTTLDGRKTARFTANPMYGERDNRFRLPRIREIQFVEYPRDDEHPADGLTSGDGDAEGVHLVADVPAARARTLMANAKVTVVGPLETRRVWFLAVNHRNRPLQDNPALRQALAFALDREAILDEVFRGGFPRKEVHRPLNGPFPADSWACDPDVKADLHDAVRAKAMFKQASQKEGGVPPRALSLKYPTGDPAVKLAVEAICKQVAATLPGLVLTPTPVAPQKLREDVEKSHAFELAYYCHDFASAAYWLWPLFDSEAIDRGGSNYLGYEDAELMALLLATTTHRDFDKVKKAMHAAHKRLNQFMPLIPLWQLHTFVAHRKTLRPTALDPLLAFSDVEQWTKEAK